MSALYPTYDSDELAFHRQVFLLQAHGHEFAAAVGTDTLPSDENIRFKVPQHLGFPGQVLERIDAPTEDGKPTHIYINSFGLTGPSGVMPRHYSEWVIERCKHKDNGIKDFLDIFNHRLISLYHRSWEKYQLPVQYHYRIRLEQNDPISQLLFNLTGTSDDTLVYLGGIFANPVRSVQGLKQIVTALAGVRITIREHIGKWLPIAPNEQTRLASHCKPFGTYAQLGVDTVLGQKVWDVNSAIEIELHAKDIVDVKKLMPGGALLHLLQSTVSEYLPLNITASWTLHARYTDLPISRLGEHSLALGRGCALSRGRQDMQAITCIRIA